MRFLLGPSQLFFISKSSHVWPTGICRGCLTLVSNLVLWSPKSEAPMKLTEHKSRGAPTHAKPSEAPGRVHFYSGKRLQGIKKNGSKEGVLTPETSLSVLDVFMYPRAELIPCVVSLLPSIRKNRRGPAPRALSLARFRRLFTKLFRAPFVFYTGMLAQRDRCTHVMRALG